MSDRSRIYLDNAATSWPKPPAVLERVHEYLTENGAPAGRGAYREAMQVQHEVARVRHQMARFVGATAPGSIVFTCNGTDSLNLALHGLLRGDEHVITTAAEHNSVLRPLQFERESRGVEFDIVPCDGRGFVDPDDIARALRPTTRLIAVTHASNVSGAVQPIDDVARIARENDVLLLVDAAQSLGHLSIDVEQTGIDLLAGSAHKGLLGILGLGVLYIRPGLESELAPWRQGGTGTNSEQISQPNEGPERFESGNLNVPGILALGAGLEFLESRRGSPSPSLARRLADQARELSGVRVIGHNDDAPWVDVVSISLDDWAPADAAAVLDTQFGIQVRAGLHCAPLIHRSLQTAERGGTVRFSFGPFNTATDADAAFAALRQLCGR